jgi:methionyl-tRNA synthetase
LEKEYSNQVSWRKAADKMTFIICKPIDKSLDGRDVQFIRSNMHYDSMEEMVGDVNFFLNPYEDEAEEEGEEAVDGQRSGEAEAASTKKGWLTGEVDIMVADRDFRSKGVGRAAVRAMLVYIAVNLGFILEEYVGTQQNANASLKSLMAKIKQGNEASIALFKGLGFQQKGEVNYFGELTMVMDLADLQTQPWWSAAMADYGEVPYGSLVDELKYTQ